jgi:hypothetical protein
VSRDPDLADGDLPDPKPGHVWITRHTWDLYFLPATVVAAAFGTAGWWYFHDTRFLKAPVPILAMWAIFRWCWPKHGMSDRTLGATPGMIPMLCWHSGWLGLSLIMIGVLDRQGIFPPEGQPCSLRQATILILFLLAWFAGLLAGGTWVERRYLKKRPPHDSHFE